MALWVAEEKMTAEDVLDEIAFYEKAVYEADDIIRSAEEDRAFNLDEITALRKILNKLNNG